MSKVAPLLHVVLVGFHHRKGSIVEFAFPPFASGDTDAASSIPYTWKHLSSVVLPDGVHNYFTDFIYFTLPSIETHGESVYGVASYRQIAASSIAQLAPDITRNSVQKSLVVLCRYPLFGFIARHLSPLTETVCMHVGQPYLLEGCMRQVYEQLEQHINYAISSPSLYHDALYCELNVSNFVRVYGRDALTLFKLILLERRVLFDGESAGLICKWIMTLLSLFPDLLENGLSRCTFIDHSWSNQPLIDRQDNQQFETCSTSDDVLFFDNTEVSPAPSEKPTKLAHSLPDLVSITPQPLQRRSLMYISGIQTNPAQLPLFNYYSVDETLPVSNPILLTRSETPLENSAQHTTYPFPTDKWGFPLSLFTKSNILPLFLHLGSLDILLESSFRNEIETNNGDLAATTSSSNVVPKFHERNVRAFLAGATNPLLRTHKYLAECIVKSLAPIDASTSSDSQSPSANLPTTFDNTQERSDTVLSVDDDGDSTPMAPPKCLQPLPPKFGPQATPPHRAPVSTKRTSIIRFCAPTDTSSLRALPMQLSQAVQLSRLDKVFIDELQRNVNLWFIARSALISLMGLPASTDFDRLFRRLAGHCNEDEILVANPDLVTLNSNDLDIYLNQLPAPQRTILMQFPSLSILDTWIRQKFLAYLRALLLSAEGYNQSTSDFNNAYLVCLRSTNAFSIWRHNLNIDQLSVISEPKIVVPEEQLSNTEGCVDTLSNLSLYTDTNLNALSHSESSPLITLPTAEKAGDDVQPASILYMLAVHPGRKIDEWEQLVGNFKRFGNLAADHGRRLVQQGISGWSKWSNEVSTNLRSGNSSSVISKFSDAFRSILSGGLTTTGGR